MLCHESLMSYYKNNSDLLFRRKTSRFDQHMTLSEIEDMLPFERDVYLIHIMHKINTLDQEESNGS